MTERPGGDCRGRKRPRNDGKDEGARIGNHTVFAGGLWNVIDFWGGFWYNHKKPLTERDFP